MQFHPYLHELVGLILGAGEFLVSIISMLCQYLHHMPVMPHSLFVICYFFLSTYTGVNNEFKTLDNFAYLGICHSCVTNHKSCCISSAICLTIVVVFTPFRQERTSPHDGRCCRECAASLCFPSLSQIPVDYWRCRVLLLEPWRILLCHIGSLSEEYKVSNL
jgi:hypothetical protein